MLRIGEELLKHWHFSQIGSRLFGVSEAGIVAVVAYLALKFYDNPLQRYFKAQGRSAPLLQNCTSTPAASSAAASHHVTKSEPAITPALGRSLKLRRYEASRTEVVAQRGPEQQSGSTEVASSVANVASSS